MPNDELTRRDFVTMTVAAGLAAAAGSDVTAQQVTEKDVEIKTPDGTCDAAFIHPASGAHPAVIIWPDAFGLRPSMRDMASGCSSRAQASLQTRCSVAGAAAVTARLIPHPLAARPKAHMSTHISAHRTPPTLSLFALLIGSTPHGSALATDA